MMEEVSCLVRGLIRTRPRSDVRVLLVLPSDASPEARAAIEAIVSDSYAWFKGLVKSRRQLDDAALERVVTAHSAALRSQLSA